MDVGSDLREKQWMDNNGRSAGLLWTYCIPTIPGLFIIGILGIVFFMNQASRWMLILLALFTAIGFAAILAAIAREPRALALSEDGLWMRIGIRKPGHELVIRWEDVNRFTFMHTFGSPSLIAHFKNGKKRALGFMEMQMIRRIIDEQKRRGAVSKV